MTANDRFKRSFMAWFWGSLVLAAVAHFAVLSLWPPLYAEVLDGGTDGFEMVIPNEEVPLPDEPPEIRRPAHPVMAGADIQMDEPFARTIWRDYEPETLPPPPDSTIRSGIGNVPTFTPFTVSPGIKNRREVESALTREYPSLLRDAGIGGTAEVWFKIDTEGKVRQTLVRTSSGHVALDAAALTVAGIIQFTPALNRDKRVEVWISLPITFTVR